MTLLAVCNYSTETNISQRLDMSYDLNFLLTVKVNWSLTGKNSYVIYFIFLLILPLTSFKSWLDFVI